MPTPCSMLSCGACHVTVRHLHLAACVSSGHAHYHSVLFMGTREVARRVAGSGRAFLQHCSLYPALKRRDVAAKSSGCWADLVCINYLKGVVYLAKLLKHKV